MVIKVDYLVYLIKLIIIQERIQYALYSYSGGPGAILGVGKTNIVMVGDQRTGINNPNTLRGQLQNSNLGIPQLIF